MLFTDSGYFLDVFDYEVIVEYRVHYRAFPLPFLVLAEGDPVSQRPLDVLDHELHLMVHVHVVWLVEVLDEFGVEQFDCGSRESVKYKHVILWDLSLVAMHCIFKILLRSSEVCKNRAS